MSGLSRLIIQGRGKWSYTFPLGEREKTRIGRGAQNEVDLGDLHASSRHAEIVRQGEAYTIRDLGSRNGTFLNGEKIDEAVLGEGDEIGIGRTRMRFFAQMDDSLPMIDTSHAGVRGNQMPDPVQTLAPMRERLNTLESTLGVKRDPAQSQAEMTRAVRELKAELAEAQAAIERVTLVNEFNRMASRLDLTPLQRIAGALEFICNKCHAENGFVMQIDPQDGHWQVLSSYGNIQDWEAKEDTEEDSREGSGTDQRIDAAKHEQENEHEQELPLSLSVVHETIETGIPVITNSPLDDPRFSASGSLHDLGIQMCMCMPLFRERMPAGVLYVDCRTRIEGFSGEDQKRFQTLGAQLNQLLYPSGVGPAV